MKIYTKKGDQGKTQLFGGDSVSKNSLRLDCYGGLDELNSHLGVCLATMKSHTQSDYALMELLEKTQSRLFDFGSHLACVDEKMLKHLPTLSDAWVTELELMIDDMTSKLPELKNFILPGGTLSSSQLHVARTVCRRVERLCVALSERENVPPLVVIYLNRLSDFLFTAARFENFLQKSSDQIWKKS